MDQYFLFLSFWIYFKYFFSYMFMDDNVEWIFEYIIYFSTI